jgi:hypothetical protein
MGKHETIADGHSLSGGDAAAPVLERDAGMSPKMALAPADLTATPEASKPDAPKTEAPKTETPHTETPHTETPESETAKSETAKSETAKSETARSETAKSVTGKPETLATDVPRIEIPKIATPATGARKIELASIEAPHIAPDVEEPQPSAQQAAASDDGSESAGPRVSRFTLLAASLALAAALGGMAGALAAYGLARPGPLPAATAGRTNLDEIQALKENVVQARVELAALKVSIDSANRNASAQFTRIGERIERIERVQAEPTTKLNKAVEALDRIARGEAGPQPKEVTGSLAPPPAAANGPSQPSKTGVEGWVVRDVHRGTALIEGRMGVIEVEQGDLVPGLGRVDAIRKQDGRWVVVTSRGLITSGR